MDDFNQLFDDHLFDIDDVKNKTVKLKEGERRMVSVLFADVKGFTALSEKLDHEDIQSLMDHIMKIFSHSIEVHGGYVDKYTGDQIMGLFGAKVASEVDTERALSSGLDMINKLKKFNKIASASDKYHHQEIDLSIRVGINTGMVTTGKIGKEREGDYTVYGDAVNLASRMESNAPTDSIMIPEYTMNLVKGSFIFKDNGDIKVKGKDEPISVFTVESKKDKTVSHVSPFIGRDDELKKLNNIYLKCNKYIKTGMTDRLTFVGLHAEAGVGKSRLIYEFLNNAVNLNVDFYSTGSCSNISSQPYNLFVSLVKDSFGISILDDKEVTKDKIDAGIDYLISLNPYKKNQLNDAKVFLGLLLGIKYEDERLDDKQEVMNHIRISIRVFIESLCQKANTKGCPFIIVLEDLHWIDSMSIQTVEYLLQTFNIQDKRDSSTLAVPLFIATYRNEYKVSSSLTEECDFIDVLLDPLTKKSSLDLIDELTKDVDIDQNKKVELYDKSSGNPFFIEEWVSLIKEKDIKETIDKSRELTDDYDIPNTLNSLILSRIDSLDKDLKILLQKATIIGEEFFIKILSLLEEKLGLKKDIKKPVDDLEMENFIQHFLKQIDQYKFKHILTRDVAYSTILKSNRRVLHQSVGEVIEENFPDIIEKFYYDLAVHYDHAEKYNKALDYLEKSGNKFQSLMDMENALLCYKRIIDIYNQEDMKRNILYYRSNTQIGKIYSHLGKTSEAIKLFESLLEVQNEISEDELSNIYFNLGDTYENIRDNDLALSNYNKSFELSKNLSDEDMVAQIQRAIGIIMMNTGRFDEAMECFKNHLNHFTKTKDKIQIATIAGSIGAINLHQGKLEEASKFFEKQKTICEELDSKQLLQQALGNLALINNIQGNYNSALAKFDEILTICEDINDTFNISSTYGNLGIAYKNIGEYDSSIKHYNSQLKIAEKSGYKRHVCSAYTNMGKVYHLLGDFDLANNYFSKSKKIILDINDKIEESTLYGSQGMLYYDMGKLDDALDIYSKSRVIFSDMKIIRGEALVDFEKSKILFSKNECKEADHNLQSASEVFKKIGDLPYLSQSLILHSKVKRSLQDFESSMQIAKEAIEISGKINSEEFIHYSQIEKEITSMHINKSSDSLLSFSLANDSKLNDECQAYIHFNLWEYAKLEKSKAIALNLYQKLYKKFPKYSYKIYIDKLT